MSILIVEDEPLIGLDMAAEFEAAGIDVIGPARDVESALELIVDDLPTFASLDLGTGTSLTVGEYLTDMGVPCVFVTGRACEIAEQANKLGIRVFSKPASVQSVLDYFGYRH